VIEAINAGRVPPAFQEDLQSRANELVNTVNCPQTTDDSGDDESEEGANEEDEKKPKKDKKNEDEQSEEEPVPTEPLPTVPEGEE